MKTLFIYNEGTDLASNTYLRMLKKTAAEMNIEVVVEASLSDIKILIRQKSKEVFPNECGVLILQPNHLEDDEIDVFFGEIGYALDLDNVTGKSGFYGATAQGIFDKISENYPIRDAAIGVIGRGNVGNELIGMLIKYGYTVVELNSRTNPIRRNALLSQCDVIVGLSSKDNILNDKDRKEIEGPFDTINWIDAGHNFDFSNKLGYHRCGKWTRELLLSRI